MRETNPPVGLPTKVIILNDSSGTDVYEAKDHDSAIRLYLRIQANNPRQICYLRDDEGKDHKIVPKVGHTLQRMSLSSDVVYDSTAGHVLHDGMFQKRDRK